MPSQSLAAQQLSHPYLLRALSVPRGTALSPYFFSLAVEPQSFPSLKEAVNSNPKKKRTYARQDARATAAAVSTKALRATRYSYNYDSDNSKGLWGGGAEDPTEDSTRQSTA